MTPEQQSREIAHCIVDNFRNGTCGGTLKGDHILVNEIAEALSEKDAQIKEWTDCARGWMESCAKAQAHLKVLREALETSVNEAERLWKMIDDVSTASDIFKPEQNNYYRGIANSIKGYMNTIKSDGYNLIWSPRAALQEHKNATCQHAAVDGDICCKCGLRVERIGDKYIISKEQDV